MKSLKIRITPQVYLDISLICYICWNAIRVIIFRVTGSAALSYPVTYCIIYGFLFVYLIRANRWFTRSTMCLFIVLLACIAITCIVHPEYYSIFFEESSDWQRDRIITQQVFAITSGFTILPIICLFNKSRDILKCLLIASVINSIFCLYLYFTGQTSFSESTITANDTYNMRMGYMALVPLLFLTYYAIEEKKGLMRIPYAILAVIMLWMVLITGSRGPLLCVVIFAFMYLMFCIDYRFKGAAKVGIVVLFVILGYLCINSTFIAMIGAFFSRIGISSRSVNAMISGVLSDNNGRAILQERAVSLISEGGPFGYGFCASRYLYYGSYPHNLFLEILIDLGYIGGSILIFLFVLGIWRFLLKVKDKEWRFMFIALVSCAFGKLFVSSSLWSDTLFWEALAIGIAGYKSVITNTKAVSN